MRDKVNSYQNRKKTLIEFDRKNDMSSLGVISKHIRPRDKSNYQRKMPNIIKSTKNYQKFPRTREGGFIDSNFSECIAN